MNITLTQPYTAEFLIKSSDGVSDFDLLSIRNVLFVSYKCSTCGQNYPEHSLLQIHLRIHRLRGDSTPDNHEDACGPTLLEESTYLQSICDSLSTGVGATGISDVDGESGDIEGERDDVDGETNDDDGEAGDIDMIEGESGDVDGETSDGEAGDIEGESGDVDGETSDVDCEAGAIESESGDVDETADVDGETGDVNGKSHPTELGYAKEMVDGKIVDKGTRMNEANVDDIDDGEDNCPCLEEGRPPPGLSGSHDTGVAKGNLVSGLRLQHVGQEDLCPPRKDFVDAGEVKIPERSGPRSEESGLAEDTGLFLGESMVRGLKDEHGYAKLTQDQELFPVGQMVIGQNERKRTICRVPLNRSRMNTRASATRLQSSLDSLVPDTKTVNCFGSNICSYCGKKFAASNGLQRHLKIHGVAGLYRCTECDKSYKRLRDLTYHLKCHGEGESQTESGIAETDLDNVRPFICNVCGDGFPTPTRLRNHEANHLIERPFKCGECDKTYKRKGDLSTHVKEHSGETPFQCRECHQQFITRSRLKQHVIKQGHTKGLPPKPTSHVCLDCEKIFDTSTSLKRHQRIHTGEKPYVCTVCARSFSHSYSLTLHMKYHSGLKPHQCPHCGKCFVQKGYFNTHVKSHSGEPTCQCSVCGQLFKWAVSLKVHMRSHTGEKPYHCKYCDQCFTSSGAFQLHVRIHTGEKPFTCSVCAKTFISSSKLCRHKKTHSAKADRKQAKSRSRSKPTPTAQIPVLHVYQCPDCEIFYEREEDLVGHRQEEHPTSYMIVVDV